MRRISTIKNLYLKHGFVPGGFAEHGVWVPNETAKMDEHNRRTAKALAELAEEGRISFELTEHGRRYNWSTQPRKDQP